VSDFDEKKSEALHLSIHTLHCYDICSDTSCAIYVVKTYHKKCEIALCLREAGEIRIHFASIAEMECRGGGEVPDKSLFVHESMALNKGTELRELLPRHLPYRHLPLIRMAEGRICPPPSSP
jgi:hypothetical protein